MKNDMFDSLLKIRQRELDEAKSVLAEAVRNADIAAAKVQEAENALLRERDTALAPDLGDNIVEAYALWLPRGQDDLRRALVLQASSTAEIARAQSLVMLARAGLRSVESVIEKKAEAEKEEVLRQEQRVIDDLASRFQ